MPGLKKSRVHALKSGDKFYKTGKPCARGHNDKRWTVNWSCASCKKIIGKDWADRNRPDLKEKKRVMYRKNPRKYINKTLSWQKNNPEKALDKQRKWRTKNWMRVISWNAKRRDSERGPGFDCAFISGLLNKQRGVCVYCKTDLCRGFHIDHRVPLSRGGKHAKSNIQILCVTCNLRKGAKNHREFMRYRELHVAA